MRSGRHVNAIFFPLLLQLRIILTTIIRYTADFPFLPANFSHTSRALRIYNIIYIIITIHYLSFPDTFPFVDGTRCTYLHQLQHIGRFNVKYHINIVSVSETRNFSYNFFSSATIPPSWLVGVTSTGRRGVGVPSRNPFRPWAIRSRYFCTAHLPYPLPTYLYWKRESCNPTFNHQII